MSKNKKRRGKSSKPPKIAPSKPTEVDRAAVANSKSKDSKVSLVISVIAILIAGSSLGWNVIIYVLANRISLKATVILTDAAIKWKNTSPRVPLPVPVSGVTETPDKAPSTEYRRTITIGVHNYGRQLPVDFVVLSMKLKPTAGVAPSWRWAILTTKYIGDKQEIVHLTALTTVDPAKTQPIIATASPQHMLPNHESLAFPLGIMMASDDPDDAWYAQCDVDSNTFASLLVWSQGTLVQSINISSGMRRLLLCQFDGEQPPPGISEWSSFFRQHRK